MSHFGSFAINLSKNLIEVFKLAMAYRETVKIMAGDAATQGGVVEETKFDKGQITSEYEEAKSEYA
jgi:hypothetical protein